MCIFCDIVKKEIPCHKIYENSEVLAFLDIAKDTEGHTLVIPKKHCENILDCPPQVLKKVIEAVAEISRHYVSKCGYEGVNVLNASGASAQQSVFHLHFHIIPRKKEDGIDAWPFKDKKDYPLSDIAEKLKLS